MRGKLCTIHDCYLDDSKDEKQEIAYVCAGFYGTSKVWSDFTEAWNRQLKAEGISFWKSSEHRALEGEFRRWRNHPYPQGRQGADLIRSRLQAVARNARGLRGIGVAVPVQDHDAVLEYENANLIFPEGNVYHRAFELTLLHSVKTACTAPRDLMVFVHDDGPDFGELLAVFKAFKQGNRTASKRLSSLLSMNDMETPALQLADMFSNAVQSTSVQLLTGNRPGVAVNEVFMLDRASVAVWTKELGEEILWGNLKFRGLPIPADLDAIVLARRPEFPEIAEHLRASKR
jgi:hypothetical protein